MFRQTWAPNNSWPRTLQHDGSRDHWMRWFAGRASEKNGKRVEDDAFFGVFVGCQFDFGKIQFVG